MRTCLRVQLAKLSGRCCSLNNKRAKDGEREKERGTDLYRSLPFSLLPSPLFRVCRSAAKRGGKEESRGSRQMQSSILDSLFALYSQSFFSRSSCVVSLIARSRLWPENYLPTSRNFFPLPRALRGGKRWKRNERMGGKRRGESSRFAAQRTFLARELFNVSSTGTGNDVEWRD